MRVLLSIVSSLVIFSVAVGRAGGQTNAVTNAVAESAVNLERADECLTILEQMVAKVTALQEQIDPADQTTHADCVRTSLARLQVLNQVAHSAREAIGDVDADDVQGDAVIKGQYDQVLLACQRAQQLTAEAEHCAKQITRKPPATKPAPTKSTKRRLVVPEVIIRPTPRAPVVRNKQVCLRQGQLAGLLIKAMELPVGSGESVVASVEALTSAGIAPLNGWHSELCTTVDDLCVVLAKAMKLTVAPADDPEAYWVALRKQGIDVDALLPERTPKTPPPLVLESEAIAILSTGVAGIPTDSLGTGGN